MKKQSGLLVVLCLILMFIQEAPAQDIQFSQFYAVPLYQNPAFAGSVHEIRGTLHQRIQWPKLSGKYTTSLLSVDKYFDQYKSGVGLMVIKDYLGGTDFSSTEIGMMYSYEINLNSKFVFRPGLQASYVSRYINYADARFPRDHTDDGFGGQSSDYGETRIHYADFSTGGILYNRELWVGFSAHHMNTPNQSFYKEVSRLPAKFAITAGYRFYLNQKKTFEYKEISITPTVHYKSQGKSDQLDGGVYGIYDQFKIGVWYRGIPFKQYDNRLQNNESMIFLAGWKYQSYSICYSYDWSISRLSRAGAGGSHEINLTIVPKRSYKPRKPVKRLPCPDFRN